MNRHDTAIGSNSFVSTFLRGGQIWFHNARMYWQLVTKLIVLCIVLTTALAVLITMAFTQATDARLFGSQIMAEFWVSIGQSDRIMQVISADNEAHALEAREVAQNSYVEHHAAAFRHILFRNLIIAGLVGGLTFISLFWWFTSHGRKLGSDQHLRGAKVVPGDQLALMIEADNRRVARQRKLRKYKPYSLVGVPYPYRMETSHTLAAGTTGSGKTQALARLLAEVRKRGDRAIIYDKMRSYVPVFFDEDAGDVILNPLDVRCANWTPFSDARTYEDFLQMATALMPDPTGSADPFWTQSARVVFAVVASKLHREGRRTTSALLYMLLRSRLDVLAAYLDGTIASSSITPNSPKTAHSVRATLVAGLAALQAMERAAPDRDPFSIHDWVKNDHGNSCLFLTSRSDKHESLRGLITVWLEMALNAIMAQERDPDRTIWIFADELPSLFKLPSLEKGLAEGRQFGAAYVLGIQTLSQLQSTYGREVAHTITGLCRTKLILNLADPDTAETAARYIGRAEIQRAQRGIGFGASDVRDGVNYTLQDKLDHLVMPEQLMRLEDLHGYLVPAATYPCGEVSFSYIPLKGSTPGFIERDDDYTDIDWHTVVGASGGEPGPKPEGGDAGFAPAPDGPHDPGFAARAGMELGLFAALPDTSDDPSDMTEGDDVGDVEDSEGGRDISDHVDENDIDQVDAPAADTGVSAVDLGTDIDPDYSADTTSSSFTQFTSNLSTFEGPEFDLDDR